MKKKTISTIDIRDSIKYRASSSRDENFPCVGKRKAIKIHLCQRPAGKLKTFALDFQKSSTWLMNPRLSFRTASRDSWSENKDLGGVTQSFFLLSYDFPNNSPTRFFIVSMSSWSSILGLFQIRNNREMSWKLLFTHFFCCWCCENEWKFGSRPAG